MDISTTVFSCFVGIVCLVTVVIVCLQTHRHIGVVREIHGEYATVMDYEGCDTEWEFYNNHNLEVGDIVTITFYDKGEEYDNCELYRVTPRG